MTQESDSFRDQRRVAMTLGAAAVVAGMAATGAQASSRRTGTDAPNGLELRAPRDGFVLQVIVKDSVTAGDTVLELDPSVENETLARIDLALQLVAAQQKNFTGDALSWQQEPLKQNIQIAQKYQDFGKYMAHSREISLPAGEAIHEGGAFYFRARREVEKAKAAAQLFDFQVKQALEQLKQVEDVLNARRAAVTSQRDRLKLAAPITGWVQLQTYKGAFVMRGQVLAQVR